MRILLRCDWVTLIHLCLVRANQAMKFKGFDNSYLTDFSGNIRLCYSKNQAPSPFTASCSLNVSRKYVIVHAVKPACKKKWSHYRPGVVQRVGRGVALLFHDRGTRRGWVVSNTPRPRFTPGKDPVPILEEACWAPGPVWTGEKSRPHRDSIPDRPARSESLYRLSYPAHKTSVYFDNYIREH